MLKLSFLLAFLFSFLLILAQNKQGSIHFEYSKLVVNIQDLNSSHVFYSQVDSSAILTASLDSVISIYDLEKNHFIWFRPISSNNYFFSTSAYALGKGIFQYSNKYFLVNGIEYGLTKHIDIGLPIATVINGAGFYTRVKYSTQLKKKLRIGLVTSLAISSGINKLFSAKALLTYGNRRNNLTIGLATLRTPKYKQDYYYTLSGQFKIFKNFYFISDNAYVPVNGLVTVPIYTYIGRLSFQKWSMDLGLGKMKKIENRILFPVFGFNSRL